VKHSQCVTKLQKTMHGRFLFLAYGMLSNFTTLLSFSEVVVGTGNMANL